MAMDSLEGRNQWAPARKQTRAEEVRQRLSDDIAQGTLWPGMPIDENEIAMRYGVSRTPVREAIRDLAAIGLVETRPHRSAVVSRPSAERLRDMFDVMAELEAMCAAHAAMRMTATERDQLETIHGLMAKVVRDNDLDSYRAINEQFHAAIYAGSHNGYLVEITQQTKTRLSPFRRAQFLLPGRLSRSYLEHEQILNAILQADGALAGKAMRGHILTVENTYEQLLGIDGPR
ncbi:MAG: GntR family transcriptional regulator [Cypionkella sp.]